MLYEVDTTVLLPGRLAGCNPVQYACGAGRFGDAGKSRAFEIRRDRNDWLKRTGADGCGLLIPHLGPTFDQNGINACASNAAVKTVGIVRSQTGHVYQELSPGFVYNEVSGGRDRGSTIGGNLEFLADIGTVPSSIWPMNTWRGRRTSAQEAIAEDYRLTEWLELPDFDAAATAILFYGAPVCLGVQWGAGGHAIVGVDVVYTNRAWYLMILNSWGEDWGDNGLGLLPERQVNSGIRARYGAWAALTATYFDSIPSLAI